MKQTEIYKNKFLKFIDFFLISIISLSIIFVIIESIQHYNLKYSTFFYIAEWIFTTIFLIEYVFRLINSKKPLNYIFSISGLIDILSICPAFLGIFMKNLRYLVVFRFLRLLRVLRIFKLTKFSQESLHLYQALKASIYKITTFFIFLLFTVLILGTTMYVVESELQTFASIPHSIYWAIVTITTVGYGDLVPLTALGKIISSIIMLLGYAIIAVPTGIVTSELNNISRKRSLRCVACHHQNNYKSNYCNNCGSKF